MLIAISGGIGSGKSVVARILTAMGFPVYDCDSRARMLIDSSHAIKAEICDRLGDCCIDDAGLLDRRKVAGIVFSDPDKLALLNEITHSAVREDLKKWVNCQPVLSCLQGNTQDNSQDRLQDTTHDRQRRPDYSRLTTVMFVETAILYQSGIDRMVDAVIEVTAPPEIRIERIMRRNRLSRTEALDRINAQNIEVTAPHEVVYPIVNDSINAVIPQLMNILSLIARLA